MARLYIRRMLPAFWLSNGPFLFNLFAEAIHWVLQCLLPRFHINHYLDDFIAVTSGIEIVTDIFSQNRYLNIMGIHGLCNGHVQPCIMLQCGESV